MSVDRQFRDAEGNRVSLGTLCRKEPEWAATRIRVLEGHRDDMLELLKTGLAGIWRMSHEYAVAGGGHGPEMREYKDVAQEVAALLARLDREGG